MTIDNSKARRRRTDGPMIQVHVGHEIKASITKFAEREDVPASHIVRRALKQYVDREEKREQAEG